MPFDKKIEIMNLLLQEMISLRCRLDAMEDLASKNRELAGDLRAENRIYRHVLETLPQRFFLKDKRLRYVLCSKMFASDFQRTVDDVIGRADQDLIPCELANSRKQVEMRILQSGQAEETEEILSIDGQHTSFISIRVPLMDDEGVSGILGVMVDTSAHRNRVLELENRNRQMDILLASQSEKMRKLENDLRDRNIDCEAKLSLRDVEILRMKREFQYRLAERDEMIQAIKNRFLELQQIVASVQRNVEMHKSIDQDEDASARKSHIITFKKTSE